jgi:hypothetical protein
LSGWSESEFQNFMAPNELRQLAPIHLDDAGIPRGIGYWLGFHREILRGDVALIDHRKAMSNAFAAVDLNADACRFGLSRWLSDTAPPAGLAIRESRQTALGQLHYLPWAAPASTPPDCPESQN